VVLDLGPPHVDGLTLLRMEELLARLRALIRRSSGQVNPELRCGPVVLDPRSGKVTLEGVEVKLTSHEFACFPTLCTIVIA
jgi:DNA-binding response OmpR family regulator